jgi:hypothetical protein
MERRFGFTNELIDIFFNTKNIGYLGYVDGSFHQYNNGGVYIPNDSESVIRPQQKLDPLKHLGPEYEEVYFTYIPAKEFEYFPSNNKVDDGVPEDLVVQPLIKVSDTPFDKSVKCILSGRRSAISMNKGEAYRLKGCGVDFQGFILGEIADIGPHHKEIRGSQFKNSCFRELYTTDLVERLLKEHELLPGNISIGYYTYGKEFNTKFQGLSNEAPMIDKYCGIFASNGDRRLGFDLFIGINSIIEKLLTSENYLQTLLKTLDPNKIKDILPNKNFKEIKDSEENVIGHDIIFNEKIYDVNIGESPNQVIFDFNSFLDNSSFEELYQLELTILKDILGDGIFTKLADTKISVFKIVVILLSKVSYEVGFIKRIFEDNQLNWGTYDYHCNAHLDNYIVLPRNDKRCILAPVDFDLSFTRDQFIDIKYNSSQGIENKVTFEDLLLRERNCLLMQLIGINMIPNIEVNVLPFDNIIKSLGGDLKPKLEGIENLLKENNAFYFYAGFNKAASQDNKEHYDLLYELVLKLLIQ